MNLILTRFDQTPNSTAGVLRHGSFFISFVIEDGFHDPKIWGKTRIPAGTYPLQKAQDTKFNAIYQTKFNMNWVMRVLNVPNFSDIEIHIGNSQEETNGCLLPNGVLKHNHQTDNFYGEQSKNALIRFYKYLDPITEPITLTIIDPT